MYSNYLNLLHLAGKIKAHAWCKKSRKNHRGMWHFWSSAHNKTVTAPFIILLRVDLIGVFYLMLWGQIKHHPAKPTLTCAWDYFSANTLSIYDTSIFAVTLFWRNRNEIFRKPSWTNWCHFAFCALSMVPIKFGLKHDLSCIAANPYN